MANQNGIDHPQFCQATNLNPRHLRRCSQYRPPIFLQIADESGFEDHAYDLYVQAFSVYEDNISESHAQLQAITLVIGTLAGAKVFNVDNFDTLITKPAFHGAELLKKS